MGFPFRVSLVQSSGVLLILAGILRILRPPRAVADDRFEYRYEDYREEDGRIHIRTHAAGFEKELVSRITAKGLLVYDGISGATLTGEPPAGNSTQLPMASIQDIRRAVSLDLGGMGKEFAVDRVAQLLAGSGAQAALVDFGADVRTVGLPPDGRPGWHIGLDDPRTPGRCWCGLGLREGAVATSGDYLRRFEINGRRYGHIIDLRTGQPVDNGCRAVSVVAPSCTQAGMLSTAVFVLGPEEGLRLLESQFGAAGAIVTDHQVITSRQFYEHVVS